ncbi:MAG: O-antigen ligase family protein [Candidatus Nomurabacteria bacterium]|nr:O-antigen ligase family protein [Candidatus Nomurabacteria bacterium]
MNLIKYNYDSTFANNVLKYGSLILVLILPIFVLGNVTSIYTSPKTYLFYGVVEILTAFWIYTQVVDISYRLSKKTYLYFLPLFCFIFWMTLAGILAVNTHLSFWSSLGRGTGLLTLYHSLAFALIIASLVKRNGSEYLYKLMNWFISGGFILTLSVWTGDEGFHLFSFLKNSSGGGLMGNSSLASAYLIFILAFGLFILASKPTTILNKWLIGITIVLILLSPLFISIYGFFMGYGILGSARGSLIGIIVSIAVAITFYLALSKQKVLRVLGVIGIILGIAIFYFSWIQLVTPNTKLHNKFTEVASGTRFVFWDVAQKSMNEHPYFGYGPENYMIAFQEHFYPKISDNEYGHEGWTDRAHNIYYDTGVSGGYPALIFYFLFIFSILYGLYNLRNNKILNNTQIAILGGFLLGYFFQNLFVFDSLNSIMTLFVLAGIVFVIQDEVTHKKNIIKSANSVTKNSIATILFIVLIISLIFFVIRPAQKDFNYYRVINMPVNVRVYHFVDLLGGSRIGEDLDIGLIANNLYELYSADPMKLKNDSKLLPLAINDIKGFLDYAEVVLKRNKSDVRLDVGVVYLYNTLNFFTGNPYNETLGNHLFKILEDAQNIAPKNPQIYRAMAQIYVWKNDLNGVADAYKKTISLDPSIVSSHVRLIQFAAIIKDQKLYNEAIIQSEKDIPGFIETYKKELNITQAK